MLQSELARPRRAWVNLLGALDPGQTTEINARLTWLVWFFGVALVALAALYPPDIPRTQDNDLANHIRHLYDYGLALREGQFPPLVAPTTNGGLRLPIFQYYSGTSYLVPGALSALGIDPYVALKIALVLQWGLAGFFACLSCRLLGASRPASFVAATVFQLFPFAAVDLLDRGAYPEVLALLVSPVLLFLTLQTAQADNLRSALRPMGAAAIVWALFIPIHPVQALLCGGMVLLLVAVFVLSGGERVLQRIGLVGLACLVGVAGAAWYWWPIIADRHELRVTDLNYLGGAGVSEWKVLLAPFPKLPQRFPLVSPGWTPQLGLHIFLSALMLLFIRRTTAIGWAAAVAVVFLTGTMLVYEDLTFLDAILGPIQFGYRFLMPTALAGLVTVAFLTDALTRRFGAVWSGRFATGLLAAAAVTAAPYYLSAIPHADNTGIALAPTTLQPHSSFYALRGTDFREIVSAKAAIFSGTEISIRREGDPFIADLLLTGPAGARLKAFVDGELRSTSIPDGNAVRLMLRLRREDEVLRFESSDASASWLITDARFRLVDEQDARPIRVAPDPHVEQEGSITRIEVEVPAAGRYQLPIAWFSTVVIKVDGRIVPQASRDHYLTVVDLPAGRSVVTIEPRPSRVIWLSAAAFAFAILELVIPLRRRVYDFSIGAQVMSIDGGNASQPVQPIFPRLGPLSIFAIKTAIVAFAIYLVFSFALNSTRRFIQSFTIGGSQFWGNIERQLERLADPQSDLSPEKREKLIKEIHAIVSRWRPFVMEVLAAPPPTAADSPAASPAAVPGPPAPNP